MLNSLISGGKGIVIVPQSTMVGKTKFEKEIKQNILKHHTLEGVITCNPNTFYGVGTNPVIAIFTAGEPHPKDKLCKFIDFREDGYEISPHIGLVETDSAKDKQQYLLDVWNDKIEAPTKFCVQSQITPNDEWLHSFYYFNDEIPTYEDFEKTIGDYLTFEFSMIMQNRDYLFEENKENLGTYKEITSLENKEWNEFRFIDIFNIKGGFYNKKPKTDKNGTIPFLGASESNNGITQFLNIDTIQKSSKTGKLPNESFDKKIFDGNCIAITNNGSVGHAYYQPHSFTCSHDITCVYLKKYKLNQYIALFLINSIQYSGKTFQFARKWRPKRMKYSKIMLPVNKNNEPDWQYMEQYSKNMMIKNIESI